MKRVLNIIFLLSCTFMMQAQTQTQTITLDELLGRVKVGMTEEEYFEEFKNELCLLDSSNSYFVIPDDLISAMWGGVEEVQQKANELNEHAENSSDVIVNEQKDEERWVINLEIEEFGKCVALAVFNEDGCTLAVLPHNETQKMQSSYLLKKAKTTIGKYATSDIIEFVTTETMDVYAGIWKNGMLMIIQAMSDIRCVTMLAFHYSSKQINESDMTMAAEYFRTGEIPEETSASSDSFEYPTVRVVKWGDSMRMVMQKEGKFDELTEYVFNQGLGDRYMFYDRINGHECAVTYAFDTSDRVYILMYSLKDVTKESCITTYNNFKYSLSKKYGEPKSDEVNKRYYYTREEWQEVYYGNLSYESSWVTDDFVSITLELTTFSGRISCTIRYIYLPLFILQQENEQSNL